MGIALSMAEDYFRVSNQADLEAIEAMFAEDATYSSDNTGLYYGRDDIMNMVTNFFGAYQELNWQIDSAKEKTPNIAEIKFSFSGKDQQGQAVQRQGIERVVVASGKIRHVEVRAL